MADTVKDIQHVVIRSIQSGKENKDMLLWKDEYLSDKDFEFVLGESYFGIAQKEIYDIHPTK